ncbi:MAG: hypothetical protein IJW46_07330, partial [Clostridia bacterium]|nr:hypothetical protein [Clostridia bacterium]
EKDHYFINPLVGALHHFRGSFVLRRWHDHNRDTYYDRDTSYDNGGTSYNNRGTAHDNGSTSYDNRGTAHD